MAKPLSGILVLTRDSAKAWREELYLRTTECAQRFPNRFTCETLPLTVGRGTSFLNQPVFRNTPANGKWFADHNIRAIAA